MIRLVAAACFLSAAVAALAVGGARAADRFTYATPKNHPSVAAIVRAGGCAPKDNMARVLKSPHPLDYAANWTGNSYIGMGWTFMPKRYVVDPNLKGAIFLEGSNLITTRGAAMPGDLFILFAEWDCASK